MGRKTAEFRTARFNRDQGRRPGDSAANRDAETSRSHGGLYESDGESAALVRQKGIDVSCRQAEAKERDESVSPAP